MAGLADEFAGLFESENNALKKMPDALSIQKKKFLIAINKAAAEGFSQEEEDLVKIVKDEFGFAQTRRACKPTASYVSKKWDDSKASERVQEILQKHAVFNCAKYLYCTEIVFLAYSGSNKINYECAVEYVLTHARQFGDQTKYIFQTDGLPSPDQKLDTFMSPLPPLPDSPFMKHLSRLIGDLRRAYDETKYRTVNANATYFSLLLLRRIVKEDAEFTAALKKIQTRDNYVKLCPAPLGNLFPIPDTRKLNERFLKGSAHLAVEAYLNTDDEKTKRVLHVTCIQHMEWNGLQLPNLFFKAAKLYGIEEGDLWDLLLSKDTAVSLINLANDYYNQYELLKADPSKGHRWFPYCRVLDGDYHRDLSMADENMRTGIILAYLIDLKIGFDNSTIRLSHWVKSAPFRDGCFNIAKDLYELINF